MVSIITPTRALITHLSPPNRLTLPHPNSMFHHRSARDGLLESASRTESQARAALESSQMNYQRVQQQSQQDERDIMNMHAEARRVSRDHYHAVVQRLAPRKEAARQRIREARDWVSRCSEGYQRAKQDHDRIRRACDLRPVRT